MSTWLVDGAPGDTVCVTDRGLNYGDGLFETIAVRRGRPRFLDAHLRRLATGLERLGIPSSSLDNLEVEVRQVSAGCEYGATKIIVTRGSGPRGYRPPHEPETRRLVGVVPSEPPPRHHYDPGIVVRLCATPVSSNRVTAGLKTLGRLEQVLARAEWSDPEIAEGLMLDEQERIISGTMTNLFFVREDRLCTPPVNAAGVAGIMRGIVLEQARAIGLDPDEAELRLDELPDTTAMFVTNSQVGIWPVRQLEGRAVTASVYTHQLMQRLVSIGVEECAA